MTFQRQEFRDVLERQRRDRVQRHETEIRQIAQAEVPMSAITGSAEWDYMLSLLEAQIEVLGNTLAAMGEAHALDPSFSHEDMARQKALMMQVAAQKDTLERVRDLPKQIIKEGEKAKLALHNYTDQ
jgi:hypothetical protein